MLQDSLCECRHCKSPACYQTFNQNLVSWKCIACGFVSNSYMFANSDVVKAYEETLPTLYQDIKFIDHEGFTWYPLFYDIHPVGIVFADGTTKENWRWCAVPYVPIAIEEREKYKRKDGTYATHKTDISKGKHFDQLAFYKAVEALESF